MRISKRNCCGGETGGLWRRGIVEHACKQKKVYA
jgi:hypothetical protein